MSRWMCAVMLILATAVPLLAEDQPGPDQLKKLYPDVLAQLRTAQDQKSQLAAEVADLHKQLDAVKAQNADLLRQAASFSEKTFFLRAQFAAWQKFIQSHPDLLRRWQLFIQNDFLPQRDAPSILDPSWPLPDAG